MYISWLLDTALLRNHSRQREPTDEILARGRARRPFICIQALLASSKVTRTSYFTNLLYLASARKHYNVILSGSCQKIPSNLIISNI